MGDRTWPPLLSALLRTEELSTADTAWAMGEIMAGAATPAQVAAFAIALRAKGETPGELAGFVEAMLTNATPIELPEDIRADGVDIVGTGGDQTHTVNISTMAAMIVAGSGLRVIKHGNRAASSTCGAADLLEYLGIPLDLAPADVATCVREVGIGFCFAPVFHAGMRHTAVPRREMGIPTVFNFLGPLTNPGRPRSGAVGCADQRMAGLLANVFAARGDSVIVMRGSDGLDEMTTTGPTQLWIAAGGRVRETMFDPAEIGIARSAPGDLRGADAAFNSAVTHRVLAAESGPVLDAVLVNAAAAIVAHGALTAPESVATDDALAEAFAGALHGARTTVESGAAAALLDRWVSTASTLKNK